MRHRRKNKNISLLSSMSDFVQRVSVRFVLSSRKFGEMKSGFLHSCTVRAKGS